MDEIQLQINHYTEKLITPILTELSNLWIKTQKSGNIQDTQFRWDSLITTLDDTLAHFFDFTTHHKNDVSTKKNYETMLKLIQKISDFIKFNRRIKITNDKQLIEMSDLLKLLSEFEKRLAQHRAVV